MISVTSNFLFLKTQSISHRTTASLKHSQLPNTIGLNLGDCCECNRTLEAVWRLPVFTGRGELFNRAYLGSGIWPGTPTCSGNCWRCRSSRRRRSARSADCCCRRSIASSAHDRDRELRLGDTGSCHLGERERERDTFL